MSHPSAAISNQCHIEIWSLGPGLLRQSVLAPQFWVWLAEAVRSYGFGSSPWCSTGLLAEAWTLTLDLPIFAVGACLIGLGFDLGLDLRLVCLDCDLLSWLGDQDVTWNWLLVSTCCHCGIWMDGWSLTWDLTWDLVSLNSGLVCLDLELDFGISNTDLGLDLRHGTSLFRSLPVLTLNMDLICLDLSVMTWDLLSWFGTCLLSLFDLTLDFPVLTWLRTRLGTCL